MTVIQKRGPAVASLLTSRSRAAERSTDSDWAELCRRIRQGRVIPVVSAALRYDSIFTQLLDQPIASACEDDPGTARGSLSAERLLSQVWAEKIGYPLPDTMELPRVAQFNRSRSRDEEQAKVDYLTFLKESLLAYADNVGVDQDLLDELYDRSGEATFSDLVQELEFPQLPAEATDPLAILARLPLPIYVTTSYHDFLEHALIAENRQPVTQVCFWSGSGFSLAPEHELDRNYNPTIERPLVYHLNGHEIYPTSLVLSEDDYLDFLVKVTQDVEVERSIVPVNLRSALSVSSLILLGYRLMDWDFRVLFRGLINNRQNASRGFSFILQLTPENQFNIENVGEARKYLETYFQPKQFNVAWGNTEAFMDRLWAEWNKWRQGS
jgi:hypothetical protein